MFLNLLRLHRQHGHFLEVISMAQWETWLRAKFSISSALLDWPSRCTTRLFVYYIFSPSSTDCNPRILQLKLNLTYTRRQCWFLSYLQLDPLPWMMSSFQYQLQFAVFPKSHRSHGSLLLSLHSVFSSVCTQWYQYAATWMRNQEKWSNIPMAQVKRNVEK